MAWTAEHDEMLCREILVVDPFTGTKKSTVARGTKWEQVAENLNKIQQVYFKVDKRAVRDRFNICSKDLRNKLIEKKESAIETDMPDVERALEDLIEREKAAETDQKTKGNQDRENAEDIRKKAMGSLGQTNVKVKKENRKKSSNGSETLNFLREQN